MNAITEQINAMGKAFVDFGWPMLIQASVLILILLLADFALRRKVRAVLRYWVWMLVLLKLMLPTSLSSPVGLGQFFGDRLEHPNLEWPASAGKPENILPAPLIAQTPQRPLEIIEQAGPPTNQAAPKIPIASLPTERAEPTVAPVTPVTWQGFVFLIWLAVVVGMGLLLLQRAVFVRGLVAQAKNPNRLMEDALQLARNQMGIRARIRLKVSANATSPAVCGLFRPVILVPNNLAPTLGSRHLRAVLLHELAHIKRGDLWVNLVQTILHIIYFYNPLLWLANAVIRRIREQAVDEAVLVAMGERAQRYPETLVSVAKLAFERPALSLRLIGVVESKNALAGRIKRILNRPTPKTARLGIVGLVVVFITAAALLPMAKAQKALTTKADQQQRVRELVYILRNHTLSLRLGRTEQWIAAIKELAEIGSPAVPELVAELERTDRDNTIRALVFTLRAIGDPRAVPPLIRALPKTAPRGSDLGMTVHDPNLHTFMAEHQDDEGERQYPRFSYGRAVNEIASALERITGHSEGIEYRRGARSDDADAIKAVQEKRKAAAESWRQWWSEHWQEFLTKEELDSVSISPREGDAVEAAGIAKFGRPIPTGKEYRLGPEIEMLVPPYTSKFWDNRVYLDLDTGKLLTKFEGVSPESPVQDEYRWYAQAGVDARVTRWFSNDRRGGGYRLDGFDTHVWQIENSRWERFEDERSNDTALKLGPPNRRPDFFPANRSSNWPGYDCSIFPATFLFTTGAGGAGILQIFDAGEDADGVWIRYRMIEGPGLERKGPVLATAPTFRPPAGTVFGPVKKVTVLGPFAKTDNAVDLDTGKLLAPPSRAKYPPTQANREWLRESGTDLVGVLIDEINKDPRLALAGDQMIVMAVRPELWDAVTVGEVIDLLGRDRARERVLLKGRSAKKGRTARFAAPRGSTRRPSVLRGMTDSLHKGLDTIKSVGADGFPRTFLFQTREGGMGILQITGPASGRAGLKIRYKTLQKGASERRGEQGKGIERTDRKIISSAGNKVKSTEDFLTAFAPGSELVVQNINGSITVNGKEKAECKIEANIEVKAKNKEEAKRLLEKVEIKVASLGTKLSVKVVQPELRSRESVTVDFEITVPRKAALDLHTSNGSLDIADITGKIEAKTNNGSISTVKTAGEAQLHTNNGKVRVSKADLKPGTIGANNGEIRCTQIAGDISVKINNGKVTVSYAKTAPNVCNVSITTNNGAIDFAGPVDFSAMVKAETQIGSITTDLPLTVNGWMRKSVSGKLGKGQGKLHIKTSIGSIRIR
jgi:beta-lactamase regulating signal transducer with metallopeptidase domain